MRIKDIMKKEVVSIRPDDNVIDSLNLLFKMQISGLPVIDKNEKLVGMFTEKEILRHMLPSYIEQVGTFVYEEDPKYIKKKFLELKNMKINQLMRQEVITTTEETTVTEVARIMLTQKVRRIPVVDKANKVVGIIARYDVLKALVNV